MDASMVMYGWFVLGTVLGIAEMLTVSFWALPFAIGAFVSGFVAWADIPLAAQLGIFAISSLLALFLIQHTLKRFMSKHPQDELRTNVDAMLGREAVVTEAIGAAARGAVKLGGERWAALAANGAALPVGTVVVIRQVGGASVVVEAKEK